MNISLTGTLGSGKSSLCELLKEKGYSVISNGVIFREIAEEKGISVVELNKLSETDKSIDKMLDDRSIILGKERDNTIFDSRMAWHFVPKSFKIFLLTDLEESARRVITDSRISEKYESLEHARNELLKRQILERNRFNELYGVDYLNLANFDLVIETTHVSKKEVSDIISEVLEDSSKKKRVFLNPKSLRLYCGEDTSDEVLVEIIDNQFYVRGGTKLVEDSLNNEDSFIQVKIIEDIGNCEDKSYLKYKIGG